MKISKYLWVEKNAGFNKLRRAQLKIQNRCRRHLYLVCTSYNSHLLFEIVESQYLTDSYKECYLVAVAKSKEMALQQVGVLINALYNSKTLSYDMIKT
ncbi:hypothetical protein [Cellulosilyticum sp. I15G10I2]|uniref:hypothetical protein n=1 Tax=Cellulosilyticum sp. I15G10I2 TaxID=1892843 RepID=UPI00085C8EE5|nr:hypothetical protein [Cellulosilyticum sp. I15G10I2]